MKNTAVAHQVLPRTGVAREELQKKGQFWTPAWVADAMIAYVLHSGPGQLFDPAVGDGAFFHAAKRVAKKLHKNVKLSGVELYEATLQAAQKDGLTRSDLKNVKQGDFLNVPLAQQQAAIVANPPYIRHHRIPKDKKEQLQSEFRKVSGIKLDGRAGLHVYFLIHALRLLEPNGRLAFIVPADICEGVFASSLFSWITRHYRLEAVVVFDAGATPFPGVDTNPIILMIENRAPNGRFKWCRCRKWGTSELYAWVANGFKNASETLEVTERTLDEGLQTGFTRPLTVQDKGFPLSRFARTMRGIATGENDFFFLTNSQIASRRLPKKYFLRAVGRTRDTVGETFTKDDLDQLEKINRPTYLLALDDLPVTAYSEGLRAYLQEGERRGLDRKALISQRRPWYRMEKRTPPPILFAYLGRRNARFIRNLAEAIPLTGFLCVYPKSGSLDFVEKLFKALSDPRTIANLPLVGKSYGGGAIKVEPRSLERLIIPLAVINELKLERYLEPTQAQLAI